MNISRQTTLFFDASVLVAGSHSPSGGSALVLEACRFGGFVAQTTALVIAEAVYALELNFPRRSLARFHTYMVQIPWGILPIPAADTLHEYQHLVHAKDLHVLAAAVGGGSDFLISLDRKHILVAAEPVTKAGLAVRLTLPGKFIQNYYHLHEDYGSLPPRAAP